jgi:hypothetical protein
MVDPRQVIELVNGRLTNVLDLAEAALPHSQFEAFRRVCLREFGDRGFKNDLRQLADSGRDAGMDGNGMGRIQTGRKGGSP